MRSREGRRTSSSGAKPVPYLRMPRTSPRACLNAVPSAIAESCAEQKYGKPPSHMRHSKTWQTYLQSGGRRCAGRPCTSSGATCPSALRAHGTSARQSVSTRPTLRVRKDSGAQRTWSRKPIPVETLISCWLPEPGWQSRLIATLISVSAVLRSITAVRAAIFLF